MRAVRDDTRSESRKGPRALGRSCVLSLLVHVAGLGAAYLLTSTLAPAALHAPMAFEARLGVEHDSDQAETRDAASELAELGAPTQHEPSELLAPAFESPLAIADELLEDELLAEEPAPLPQESAPLARLAPSRASFRRALAARRRPAPPRVVLPPPAVSAQNRVTSIPAPPATATARRSAPAAPLRVLFAPDARRYYPVAARRMRLQGTVQVRITIDANGFVMRAVVERGSGSELLDGAALALARDYRFSAGRGLRSRLLPVVFRLDPVASVRREP